MIVNGVKPFSNPAIFLGYSKMVLFVKVRRLCLFYVVYAFNNEWKYLNTCLPPEVQDNGYTYIVGSRTTIIGKMVDCKSVTVI